MSTKQGRSRLLRLAALLVLAVLATACGKRRPPFDDDDAQTAIAGAFQRPAADVAIYTSLPGTVETEWLVEFKVDGDGTSYQARFNGETGDWKLKDLRLRDAGGTYGAWVETGVVIRRAVHEMGNKAGDTMKVMKDLAGLIERYATDNSRLYPAVDISGLQELIMNGGYAKEWHYSADAWGNGLLYHAAPDGQSYLIVSPGADGRFDQDPAEYFAASDQGNEAYGGQSGDPERDLIYATGAFVQSYVAEP